MKKSVAYNSKGYFNNNNGDIRKCNECTRFNLNSVGWRDQ